MDDNRAAIHSIETFATFEGHGIRYAVFLEGCPLRCVYCHNPDTWSISSGKTISVSELLNAFDRYAKYYQGGGITFSGGEPLMQHEFLGKAVKAFKNRGIHVAIDTSAAIIPSNIDEIIDNIDLAIVDLKFHNTVDYRKYTNGNLNNVLTLLSKLSAKGVEIWVRTVITPDINNTMRDIESYTRIVARYNVTKYELLGYHTMGVYKYAELGIPYALEGVEALDPERLDALQQYADICLNASKNSISTDF